MADTKAKNPRTMYHSKKFPPQHQAPPGLEENLTPAPDCGEKSYTGHGRLARRKALITGGDSGIGRAAAIAYAREGADVAIAYLAEEDGDAQQVKAHIEKAGQKALLLPGDLRDEAYARRMVDEANEALGGLDILVLNAAKQVHVDDLAKMDMGQVREVFDVNIISMFYTAQQALQYLTEGGSIITTTSVQAFTPSPGLVDYAATKAAIVQFTKALSHQLAPRGIRVNSVAPGPIWTPLQVTGAQPEDAIPTFGQNTPLGRAGQPVELSWVYVFLASHEASYVTGQVYGVTGGILTA